MKKNVSKKKRLKLHAENRDDVVSELQRAYVKYSSDLGNFTSNLSKTDGNSYSCAVEDLLIEMTRKELQRCNDSGNTNCHRCKHLLNISQTFEKISVDTEECVADLNFVQSIVWLRSAILFMKTIPVEQFHLVFYKQWKNTEKDFHFYNQDSSRGIEENDYENLNGPLSNQKSDANLNDDSEFLGMLYNARNEKYSTSCAQQINQETETFSSQKRDGSSVFTSFQSLERFFNVETHRTQQDAIVNNYIVQDSDMKYSSDSNMFRDSPKSESNINEKDYGLSEESDLINEKSADNLSLFSSESSAILKITSLGMKDDLAIHSGDNNFLDIALSNESFLSYEQNCSQLREQLTSESIKPMQQTCDSIFRDEIPIVSPNRINDAYSPKEDSAYDTYQLSIDRICECRDFVALPSQKIDNITPYEREGIPNDMHENNWTSKQNSLSSQSENGGSISNKAAKSCSQKYKNFIEDTEYEGNCGKRKKLKSVHELTVSETGEKNVRNISAEWLKYTLDTLNVDDVAFQSMKMILAVLQNEKIARQYMRKRCWKNTLEEQAVNAILDYCDISEAENKTNVYTQEIVQVVTSILDKSIETVEFDKVTILIHQISIVLQLCISTKVCVEIINYLTTKLKFYENVLITLINNKKADVHSIINQLHIIFYSLTFCLQKYRSAFCNKEANQFEEDVIPPVVDLWKKQLNFEGVIVEDSKQTRERRWLMILSDFTLVAMENFVQFAKKSQKLVNLLSRE